ncbi:hypothetical protein P8C59_002726 [Phyllachora maydis]|uniref:Dethiobiotin synthase n=1 Tax=Phyllachora maydis TaxID=1825666 RepID=A0AAD9M8A4_9PEZI|nr:hypothetical protein P8C59_002726 [Phyllachora maydis]
MAPAGSLLFRHLRIYQVYGANTDVGKTIFTTILATAASKPPGASAHYLKPVSTGPPDEADARHMAAHCAGVSSSTTLFQYDEPVSPHLAAARAPGRPASDDAAVLGRVAAHCTDLAAQLSAPGPAWLFVETAGGVHSPAPSGTPQADLYAPLRLPVVLVGDAKLGGIATTLAALEALKLRGYDVAAVLMFRNDVYANHEYLRGYLRDKFPGADTPLVAIPPPPTRRERAAEDRSSMQRYYQQMTVGSHGDSGGAVPSLLQHLDRTHTERIAALEALPGQAHETIWYPFTQQKTLTAGAITAIDSAHGHFFQTFGRAGPPPAADPALLRPCFDGSASWWTQGLGHGSPALALAAAHAAGRYGHVLFPGMAHQPAVDLARGLVRRMHAHGNTRLRRVFFSDNGSTGVEVALKMALRATRLRCGDAGGELGVLALRGGYHGDTLGAMDCAEPGAFNEKVEWYRGRGVWLDYPTVRCAQGRWTVTVPPDVGDGQTHTAVFDGMAAIFDLDTRKQSQAGVRMVHVYEKYMETTIREQTAKGHRLGALLIEPVVLGAGGMRLVDPLFQHTLVNLVRRSPRLFGVSETSAPPPTSWSGLPVIFDEVFTGLYRLGHFTSSSLIAAQPDISVHAKLLTGGLVPLCVTLASEAIFATFARTEDKTDALLHGHSYTAHPVGCAVAVEALGSMDRLAAKGGAWDVFRAAWSADADTAGTTPPVWSVWPRHLVAELSRRPAVAGVWALGSVLALHLRVADGGAEGYASTAAARLRDALAAGEEGWAVHSRVLGNVLYLMGSQTITADEIKLVGDLVIKVL